MTPIALVVLAAGAGAYAYAIDRGTISDADRAARRADVFPSFHVEEVSLVDLEHDGESLILERKRDGGNGASWAMTSPKAERADGAAEDAHLRELELAKRVREVSGHDAAALGTPRVRGRLVIGAVQYRFALGADAPRPNGGAYMHIEGDATFVVGRSLKVQLLRGADAYRERTARWRSASARRRGGCQDGHRYVRHREKEDFVLPRRHANARLARCRGPTLCGIRGFARR